MDDSYSDSKVFKSPSSPPPPQINYMMKTIPSWAAAFCPAFPPPTGILFFFFFLTIYLFGCTES